MEKIFFNLTIEDDYPPVSTESLWANKISSGNYKVKNIPFYSKDVCYDDVVSVKKGWNGENLFYKIIRHSGNSTLRIIFFENSFIDKIVKKLKLLGCSWESMNTTLYAVNIPRGCKRNKVIDYLDKMHANEILDYEFGKLSNN